MELRGGGLRWVAVGSGIVRQAFRSTNRITSAHGPFKKRFRLEIGPIRSDFVRLVPFSVRFGSVLVRFFSKYCFLPTRGAQFCKTTENIFDQKNYFFDPSSSLKKSIFWHCIRSCRSFGRSDRNFFVY